MEPRVTKHDKRLDLSYHFQSRIRCSAVYPTSAPNGSTIIFCGCDDGLRVLWRGGRRLKSPGPAPTSTKASEPDVIVLDDSEDERPASAEATAGPEYEEEGEGEGGELDSSKSYPDIVHETNVATTSAVSTIAVLSTSAQWSHTNQSEGSVEATIAVAGVDGQILLLRIPLDLKVASLSPGPIEEIVVRQQGSFVRSLDLQGLENASKTLYLSAVSHKLELWNYNFDALSDEPERFSVTLRRTCLSASFHPTARHPLLLLVDSSGACRTYEPPAVWSAEKDINSPINNGTWLATFHAPFAPSANKTTTLPSRKKILDARWILNGRCVLAILDDGAWGVWDTTAAFSPDKSSDDFVVSGYLVSATAPDTTDASTFKRSNAALAPMTPNTRKTKSTALFSAPQPKSATNATRGGISATRILHSAGSADQSILIWFGSDIYSIPSMQTFWKRSTTGSSGLGSLYAPGIAHVQGLNLFNENISSVAALLPAQSSMHSAKVSKTPDFVVSADSRLVIVQHKSLPDAVSLFSKEQPAGAQPQDQRMLDAGELDLGGMNRILNTINTKVRKVGFAH